MSVVSDSEMESPHQSRSRTKETLKEKSGENYKTSTRARSRGKKYSSKGKSKVERKTKEEKKKKKVTFRRRKSKQGRALEDRVEKEKAKSEKRRKAKKKSRKRARWVRTQKRKLKIKKYKEIPVNVVDEHDGTMVVMLRAIEQGYLPRTGIKLLHFDSHPDLGCIPDKFKGLDDAYNQKYSIRELYDATDIATFITPMVLMNHVDYVVWACAYWCDQFNPGTYKLLVGKDKNDGCIKIAAPKNKKLACLDYWDTGNSVCKVEDFEYSRPWTLTVVRYSKNCKLPQRQLDLLADEFSEGPWVLDIDEDFFSCNNPYFDEFRDLFGEKMHKTVKKIYGHAHDFEDLEDALMSMFRTRSYKKSWKRFEKSSGCKHLLELMNCSRKKKALKELHGFLRVNWPNGGLEDESSDSDEEWEGWEVKDFFSLDDLHSTGQLACLPHHISTAKEIKNLANDVDDLLGEMCDPSLVCVATSRLDRYLPDSQAGLIHGLLENMLMARYGTKTVHRLDKPKFSVDKGESTDKKRPDSRYVTDICKDTVE